MKLPINYADTHWTERRLARQEYMKRQKDLCYFCDEPLSGPPLKEVLHLSITKDLFPPNFFEYPVHLHHSHDTGMTIGAVHCFCNAVLWEHHNE